MSNRRKNRYREKKPLSTSSLVDAGVGAASTVAYFILLGLAAGIEGDLKNIYGGISVLAMFAAIVVLIRAIRISKNDNFEKWSRVVGVVIPAFATGLWMMLYIVGIFMG